VELIVVIFIISVVASVGAGNYRAQRAVVNYNDSIVRILEMIKTARNYAVTSKSYYVDFPTPQNIVPEEGYGVYIEQHDTPGQSKVILFANTDSSTDPIEEREQYEAGEDLILDEYTLPIDTDFIGLSTDNTTPSPHTAIGGTSGDDEAVIIFRPPLAKTSLAVNDSPLSGNLVELDDLYLQFRRPDAPAAVPSKYIHINKISGFPEILE
jgi:type II secretory pathway pseudopilin PulG